MPDEPPSISADDPRYADIEHTDNLPRYRRGRPADEPPFICGRCGRVFDQPEASINGVPYCHPAWSIGRTCYTEQSYEMTFNGTYPHA